MFLEKESSIGVLVRISPDYPVPLLGVDSCILRHFTEQLEKRQDGVAS
jgi:hypothetical protein